MPTVALSPVETKLVALAMEKKAAGAKAVDAQFGADVAVVLASHTVPAGVDVSFQVGESGGVVFWPDADGPSLLLSVPDHGEGPE